MNKKLSLALLVAMAAIGPVKADDTIDHSFFSVDPLFRSGTAMRESLFHNDRMSYEDDKRGGAVELVVFGGKSTEQKDLGKYFTPYNKNCFTVIEGQGIAGQLTTADQNGVVPAGKDMDARHFNIATVNGNFQSKICFCPQQTFAGVGLAWKQSIARRDNDTSRFWFEAASAVMHVNNDVHLSEQIVNNGGGAQPDTLGLNDSQVVGSMKAAFKQASWKFGKIDGCRGKTGLADIELKLGINWGFGCEYNMVHGSSYVGMVIPTGNKPCGKYMFEPIVGNNKHFGLMVGSNFGGHVWHCDEHSIDWEVDLNSRYLFENTQVRSFNVYGKPFSRYMSVYATQADAVAADGNAYSGTAGINIFTDCVKVDPRFSQNMNTEFTYSYCNFRAGIGHGFFARQAEKVCLNKWTKTPQFKAYAGEGDINLARNIKQSFGAADITTPADNYVAITRDQLDLDSAAHPAVLSNTIYGVVGYEWPDYCRPMFASLGGSYEWSHVNAALSRWALWGKFGFSY